MRGLRADLAATAEAARTSASSATAFRSRAAGYTPDSQRILKEAELMVQSFRDDIRVELRQHGASQPLTPVALETVRTVLDQARIAIRNSLAETDQAKLLQAAISTWPGSRRVAL
jgi:hypothetical protein